MQVPELIEAIYATVDDPTSWPRVLSLVGDAISARNTLLFVSDEVNGQQNSLTCTETPPEMLHAFLNHYASVNVLAEPCDRLFPEQTVRYSHWALTDTEFERSEFYADFFQPLDLHYSVGIKAPVARGASAYLSAQRSKRDEAFTEEEGRVWQMLLPHLRRALMVQAHLASSAIQRQSAEQALLQHAGCVIGVNGKGSVCYASVAAEKLIRTGDVLSLRNGKLQATDPLSDVDLQMCLKAVLGFEESFLGGRHGAVTLRRRHPASSIQLVVLPRRAATDDSPAALAALLFLRDPSQGVLSRQAALSALFALTATELRVADLLLAGKEVKEIAAHLLLSSDATRFHVKRIFAKTGVRRQAELIRLMLELPGQSSRTEG